MNKWDERFLKLAEHVSGWSKDPSTKVGAVITDQQNRVISVGYNGFPAGIADTAERLNNRDEKLDLTIHAEENALLFAQRPLNGCNLYVWPLPPCIKCAAKIVQTGIKRVISPACKKEKWIESCEKGRTILTEARIIVIWHD